jgi:hypothetical protein
MNEELKIFAAFLSGGTAGSLITWFAACRRDAKNRIITAEDELFKVIAQQRAKLERMKYDEAAFFAESIPVLSEAVHKTKRILTVGHWSRLHRVLIEYQAQDKSEFTKGRARAVAAFDGRKPHADRLSDWLDRFEDAAKKTAA